jgi:hypothetical protein
VRSWGVVMDKGFRAWEGEIEGGGELWKGFDEGISTFFTFLCWEGW